MMMTHNYVTYLPAHFSASSDALLELIAAQSILLVGLIVGLNNGISQDIMYVHTYSLNKYPYVAIQFYCFLHTKQLHYKLNSFGLPLQ